MLTVQISYTGWGMFDLVDTRDDSDRELGTSGSFSVSELALSNTNEIRYSRVGTGKLKSANRYALVNDKTGYMMSYNPVAVKPGVPNRILSLTQTTSGDAWKAEGQNSYYYKADGDKVYLDHSNRSLATIVIRQGTLATNASFSTSGNKYSKLFSGGHA